MCDQLVSFCIRRGQAKFCKFFMEKAYGTIDNFLLDEHMDEFICEPSFDPTEKALFVEKINEYVESRNQTSHPPPPPPPQRYSVGVNEPARATNSYIAPSLPTPAFKAYVANESNQIVKRPRKEEPFRPPRNKEFKVQSKNKIDESAYIINPEGSFIYEVNPHKTYECVRDGIFFISKYRLPEIWSSDAIYNFLQDASDISSCKDFCNLIKSIANDIFPVLADMFLYEMPRNALSGVCSLFAHSYPHLDDVFLHLKTIDQTDDAKYCKFFKEYTDVSEILRDKLKNKFRNRSYRLKAKNLWPYNRIASDEGANGKLRPMGLKRRSSKIAPTGNSHASHQEDNKDVLNFLANNHEAVLISGGEGEAMQMINSLMHLQ